MEYFNHLTVPSGKYFELFELKNKEYLKMAKFIESENYQAFFQVLDEEIKKSIPSFDELDIIDKTYVYIAFCLYSVRASIQITNKLIGSQTINLSLVLNNMERAYGNAEKEMHYKFNDKITLDFKLPSKITFENNVPWIDWMSGLKGYNNIPLDNEKKKKLIDSLSVKQLAFIEKSLQEAFRLDCDILEGVPMNSLKINLGSPQLVGEIVGFYKIPLDNFYRVLYGCIRHLRISFNDCMNMTHVETSIMMNLANEENEKLKEENEKQ